MAAKKTEFDIADILDDEPDESLDEAILVTGPSGSKYPVFNEHEAHHYESLSERYQSDNIFVNVSDIQELDRILMMELMTYRWGTWLIQEMDYSGKKINAQELQKSIGAYSKEIREIKRDLGMDKSSRDRDQGENLAAYLENLRLRAKEFGVAAFISRSKTVEQLLQVHSRSLSVSSLLIVPQLEQVFDDGSNLPIFRMFLPYQSALYSNIDTKVDHPASLIACAKLWFLTIF